MPVLPRLKSYDDVYRQFRWQVPARYNIGVDVCDRWAAQEPGRLAILHVRPNGGEDAISYGALREISNRLANVLRAQGVARGDRVGILLPQAPEVAAAHIAIYKLGAVALPIAVLFGPDALSYRLQNSAAKALITNAQGLAKLDGIRGEMPELTCVVSVDDGFADLLARASPEFTPVDTAADDPAMMIYTSGTTGQPKGALHAHRVLLGHLPGIELPHFPFPQAGDRYWTPADWAWAGGLLDALLPSLHYGVPVVAYKFDKFDPERAFALMAQTQTRNAFIPPTALRMMRAAPSPRGRYDFKLRSVASGGELLGVEALEWGREAFGLAINEFYGQTECNLVLGSCAQLGMLKAGCHRQADPRPYRRGHRQGRRAAQGRRDRPDRGQAARSGDVPAILGQRRRPRATSSSATG